MKILIDVGHGGINTNGYTTASKRSPHGFRGTIFEGVSNRAFAFNIAYRLSLLGVPVEVVNADTPDIALHTRCQRINKIVGSDPKGHLLISLHSNAAPTPTGGVFTNATGMEIFAHTNAKPDTIEIAEHIAKSLIADLPDVVWRYGGNGIFHKTANFQILRKTVCPAVLLEVLFMNGIQDYERLTNPDYRVKLETAIVSALHKLSTITK